METKQIIRTINQTELAKMFKKDRATIRTWLEEENVQPTNANKQKNLYDYDEAVAAVNRRANQKWKEAKVENETKLLEVKLQKELQNFAPVSEFAELTHEWVGWLHRRLVAELPAKTVKRISKAKTEAEAQSILTKDIQFIFDEFRANPKKFLDNNKKKMK